MKEVIIESIELGKKWIFPCNRWLDKKEEDGKIDVELTPIKNTDFDDKAKKYIIEVFTGDHPKAGTGKK